VKYDVRGMSGGHPSLSNMGQILEWCDPRETLLAKKDTTEWIPHRKEDKNHVQATTGTSPQLKSYY
jgi:hypothetical protein